MSTATLERKAKAEPTAAPPEPLYPCRSKLKALLSEHEAVTAGISDFEAKLSRATLDLDKAIDDDDDAQIDRFQSQTSIYNVKLSAKKSVLDRVLSSIPSAIAASANEYSTALLTERDRRATILSDRIADTLQADKKRMLEGRFLDDVIDLAGPIQEIDHLRFSYSLVGESDAATLGIARHLLDCYSELLSKSEETLLEQTKLIRASNPRLTFEQAWQMAYDQLPTKGFTRPGSVLLAEAVADIAGQVKSPKPAAPPKTVAATVPKAKGALVEGGFFNLLPGAEEEE
jgi:hypothetical protein